VREREKRDTARESEKERSLHSRSSLSVLSATTTTTTTTTTTPRMMMMIVVGCPHYICASEFL
jgi:hypothetical protein